MVSWAGHYADHDLTAHARDSWTPRSGFVQPAFRAFMTHEFHMHRDRLQPDFSRRSLDLVRAVDLQLDREGSDFIF
jgi:hypothetical protein